MSFRLKTVLGIAVIEMTVMAILIIVNQLNYGGTASTQLYQRVRGTADLFATMVTDAVISTDLATLDAMIENTLSNDELVYLRVRNASDAILSADGVEDVLAQPFRADANFDAALADNRVDIAAPITIAGQSYGSVEIGVSTLAVEAEMASALRWNMLVAALGMSLVAVFGFLLGSVLTSQLSSLRQGARKIASGELDYQIDVRGRDELAETARCFNEMSRTLARDRAILEDKQSELLEKRDRTNMIVDSMKQIAEGVADVPVPDHVRADEIGDMARATVVFRNAMNEVQRARAEQARLILAFDQVDEHVAIFGEDGQCIFQNRAFRTFNDPILKALPNHFSYEAFLREGLSQGQFPGATGQEDEWLNRRIAGFEGQDIPVEVARPPDRTLLTSRSSVEGIGMVVSSADVSELKTSQAQLVQASKLATLGEMATGIAHELNQPLGVIRMASNNCMKRIQKGSLDPEYLTAKLQRMSEQTERASQIINHMRIFGRTADGTEQTFNVTAAVANACNLMSSQLRGDGVAVVQKLLEDEAPVSGQQVMFEQVILNLLSNARDAIHMHGDPTDAPGEISVGLIKKDDGSISITVDDNGGGVPEAVLDRLFDPFFTTKDPGKGTGLGLSISYGIIRDMGGTIAATNTNRGARFRIDLPVAKNGAARVAA